MNYNKSSFLSLKLDHSLTSKISVALLKNSYEIIVNLISMDLYNNNDTCTEYIRIAKKTKIKREDFKVQINNFFFPTTFCCYSYNINADFFHINTDLF